MASSTQKTPYVDQVGNTAGTLAFVIGIPGSLLVIATSISFGMYGIQSGDAFLSLSVILTLAVCFPVVLAATWAVEASRG